MKLATILDIETTGKNKPEHRIIEFSARLCCLETYVEKREILWRFNPQRNIDAKAFEVHKISLEELKDEPLFEDKAQKIADLLAMSAVVVAHNGDWFDFDFINRELNRCGIKVPKYNTFDTMKWGTFATDLGKNPRLEELCFALDVEYDPNQAHKGDYDTACLRDCFFNGLRFNYFVI